MKYDGYIRIGTELDSKSLENQIKSIEKKLNKLKSDNEKLSNKKSKVENNLISYEEEKRIIQELTDESLKYAQTRNEIETHLENEKAMLSDLDSKYSKQKEKLTDINNEIEANKLRQQELNAEISEMNTELNKIKGYENIKNSIDDVKEETGKTVKTVGKWALAVFGVRAAYGFIRQSVSTLAQYNEKLASDLEYIRFSIASALKPVIEYMVSLTYKLLQYINYIAQAWFGVNLFADASAKSMNKSAKSAEKMKKSLAGFDEMNTIDDASSGTSSSSSPSVDLSSMQGEIPSWIKWIAENKELVIAGLAGIAAGLLAVKFGASGIISLGIGLLIASIVLLIQDIIDMIKNPSWENFVAILGDIAIGIGAIMLIMGNWWGLLVAIIGLVVKLIAENWDKIWAIIEPIAMLIYEKVLLPAIDFVKAVLDTIVSYIKTVISIIGGIFTTVINLIANPFIVAKDTIIGVFNGIKTFFNGFVQVIKSLFNGDIKGVLNGFKTMFKGVMNSLWTIAKAPINLIIGGINALIKGMNKIKFDVPDWVPGIGGKKLGFNIKEIPKLASGGIINMPGKGVPLGGAIGGEAGREGVLPLTNSQAMEELGSAIGRYITINLTNNTQLDGRTIARHQSMVQANRNFAMNR